MTEPQDPGDDREPQREFVSLMTTRVRDAVLRRPFFVDGALDLVAVCRRLSAEGRTDALVDDAGRTGIFTTTDLRDALLRGVAPDALPVREVARFELVAIDADAALYDALLLMVRHRIHRLAVRDGGAIVGVLNQLDLLRFVSNHSHLIASRIDAAASIDELKAAALQTDALIALLHDGGIRIERIGAIVGALNARLFAKLWSMLAPPALVGSSCLVVMGSEGRGEQVLKTDQDNALILADDADAGAAADAAARFSDALAELGYPPCPGGIMVRNPAWRQPLARFRETIRGWVHGDDPEGPMHLAIFLDAQPVAGDPALLEQARAYLQSILAHDDAFLARFAKPVGQFAEPGGWWSRLAGRRDEQPLDLKKLGTFPIVHGVRALALEHGLAERGTAERLQRLVERGAIDAALARDLVEALRYLMALKLKHQLAQRQRGEAPGNLVRPAELGTLERDPLRDSLAIVRRFRAWLGTHYRLDVV